MEPTSNPNTIPSVPAPSPEVTPPPAEKGQDSSAGATEKQLTNPERGREQLPNPEQAGPSQSMVLPPVQLPAVPIPSSPVAGQTTTDDTPLIADDVDVIEMEWVNKAKKIIKETRDDPHAQEEAVEQLQIEYLKKRYGKEIKKSRSK